MQPCFICLHISYQVVIVQADSELIARILQLTLGLFCLGMNGIQTVAHLRAQEKDQGRRGAIIIAFTAAEDEQIRSQFQLAGKPS
jgi:CheY-like chemotaxis protein